jgi:predicted histidine transporter YuiF (NhaC family)
MAGLHEKLKQAEQTAQVPYIHIGLTMALIGVLIALCAAMVGSHRSALTRAMIEQTEAHSDYRGESAKLRIVMVGLENLRGGLSLDSAGAAQLPLSKRFLRLCLDYSKERDFAKACVDSYQPVIDTHFNAVDGYENAQLVAEIAIVIALIAVLLSNRPAWLISILLAVICIGMLTSTWLNTRRAVAHTLANIRKSEYAYQQLRRAHLGANQDERTVEEVVEKYRFRCGLPERPLSPL